MRVVGHVSLLGLDCNGFMLSTWNKVIGQQLKPSQQMSYLLPAGESSIDYSSAGIETENEKTTKPAKNNFPMD